MKIETFVVNTFQENTYIYFDENTLEAILIDPGASYPQELDNIKNFIDINKLKVKYIIITHGHIDHILANNYFRNLYNVKSYMHKGDFKLLDNILDYSEMFGFILDEKPIIDEEINNKTLIKVGNLNFSFLHTPGHSNGSVCMIDHMNKNVFCGDLIFNNSIGRTDLPGGNYNEIIQSIKEKLFAECTDDYTLYPGHMSKTTVYQEKKFNRFLI